MPHAAHTIAAVNTVALPIASRIVGVYPRTDLADAYAIELPAGASSDPEVLARYLFAQQAPWAKALMAVRDAMVSLFGLKTAAQLTQPDPQGKVQRVGIFRIYSTSQNEIVLGEDDQHLDFRLSLMCAPATPAAATQRLVLSIVVHCHNRLGRLYIFIIAPFHRLIAKSVLRRAARRGWPVAALV